MIRGTPASAAVLLSVALAACTARPRPRGPAMARPTAGVALVSAAETAEADAAPAAAARVAPVSAAEAAPANAADEAAEAPADAARLAPVSADEPEAAPADAAPGGDDGLGGAGYVRGFGVAGYVAFTFDDGPDPHQTPRVLAALAAHDVHATFFVVGRLIWGLDHPRRREELRAIAAAGHDIGNHTWGHLRLPTLGPVECAREIDQASAVIRWVIGRPITIVRAPYGKTDAGLHGMLHHRGLTEVGWSIDVRDWAATSPAQLRRDALAAIVQAGGGVLVLHDDKWITATALPGLLLDLERFNCRRLAKGQPPILPVSLHYFTGRPVPAWVEARTQAYRTGLATRCADPERVTEPGVDNHTASQ